MGIGNRINKLRSAEMLSQKAFAERLGIKQSYVSDLENGRNRPSEALVISICREFQVNIEWLKAGAGEMYDQSPRFSGKGGALVDKIIERLTSNERPMPLSTAARVMGVDPDRPSRKPPYAKDLSAILTMLVRILEEGDRRKIEAVMAQLRALAPDGKREEDDCEDEGVEVASKKGA